MSWAPFPPSRERQCCSNRSSLMPNRWVALVVSCDRQECMLSHVAKTCELTRLWVYPLKNIFSQSAWNFLCLFCLLGAVAGSDSWHIPRRTRLPHPQARNDTCNCQWEKNESHWEIISSKSPVSNDWENNCRKQTKKLKIENMLLCRQEKRD